VAEAIVNNERTFFNLSQEAMEQVVDLNLNGTVRPSQVFGEAMADQKSGSIINISSMSAQKPLTRVIGYSVAKAAVENLTRWLAVELAKKFGEGLRVNAIAPGFFLGDQNRALLINKDQSLTNRGQTITDHTPMSRFGLPDDLVGTAIWLASMRPAYCMNCGHNRPSSNERTVPDTAPTAKRIVVPFAQRLANRS